MNKQEIIKQVQVGNKGAGQGENIFVPMTPEQFKARKDAFVAQLKENIGKLGNVARVRLGHGQWAQGGF